ncbi:uncharacterized protein LOC134509617 isoform X2 [Chroicocephalus ridibundus]|uniref:uncharacterized protein LOC134509617 isoform X2 n=1 Tax=Chroicocephalus ridibundus TaxID=1192867 RepID=UPI002FDCD07D
MESARSGRDSWQEGGKGDFRKSGPLPTLLCSARPGDVPAQALLHPAGRPFPPSSPGAPAAGLSSPHGRPLPSAQPGQGQQRRLLHPRAAMGRGAAAGEKRGDLPRAAELPQSSPGELVLSEATRAAFLHPWFWWEMERCRAVSQASRKVSQCRRERRCSQEAPAHRAKAVSSHPAPGALVLCGQKTLPEVPPAERCFFFPPSLGCEMPVLEKSKQVPLGGIPPFKRIDRTPQLGVI